MASACHGCHELQTIATDSTKGREVAINSRWANPNRRWRVTNFCQRPTTNCQWLDEAFGTIEKQKKLILKKSPGSIRAQQETKLCVDMICTP